MMEMGSDVCLWWNVGMIFVVCVVLEYMEIEMKESLDIEGRISWLIKIQDRIDCITPPIE